MPGGLVRFGRLFLPSLSLVSAILWLPALASLSGCGGATGVEGRTIPTPASLDGRAFRETLNRGPYRTAAQGLESDGPFELRAQVNPPRAERGDLRMLPRAGEGFVFSPFLVVRGTFVDDGPFRLKPEPLPVDAPAIPPAPVEHGELSVGFLDELARRGSLPLPLLSDSRQILRAERVLLRDGGGTDTELPGLLDRSSLVPILKHTEALAKRGRNERVIIAFETLALGGKGPEEKVRRWLESKRPLEAEAMAHPGHNAHLKEAVDRALDVYRDRFRTDPISMLDFVERFRLADCKMVALATLQKGATTPAGPLFRAFVVSGNRVERPDRIDLLASNHAWNAALDGRRGESLVFADFTPETRRPLEYVFDGSALRWLLGRLETAQTREEFSVTTDRSVLRAAVETVPAALGDVPTIDRTFARLAVNRVEGLLPSQDWEWEGVPTVRFFPNQDLQLVRRHRRTGERVFVTIDPVFHWGRRGEAIYERSDRAGPWDLRTDGIPRAGALALNGKASTTFEDFTATVTSLEKSSSSHSPEYYWRVEILFSAAR